MTKKISPKNKTAFSLIELSIVILIIGLIVLAVLGGRKLVEISNLSKARALTNSSPVSGIENLRLWLEATSKESFGGTSPTNTQAITSWSDINPQSNNKYTITGSGTPTYASNAMNGLPALSIDTSQYFNSNFNLNLSTDFTIFVVVKYSSASAGVVNNVISQQDLNGTGASILYKSTSATAFSNLLNGGTGTSGPINYDKPLIHNLAYDRTNLYLYLNGGVPYATVAGTITGSDGNWIIGAHKSTAGNFLQGHIGELIIFDRYLSAFETGQINTYLSKKWGITLK